MLFFPMENLLDAEQCRRNAQGYQVVYPPIGDQSPQQLACGHAMWREHQHCGFKDTQPSGNLTDQPCHLREEIHTDEI